MKIITIPLAAAVLLIAAGATPAHAAAADTAPPTVEAIEFSREAITVDGLDVKLLVVSIHLTDESGVEEIDTPEGGHYPWVSLGQQGASSLTLGRGTTKDGWWTGGLAITTEW